MKSNIQGSFDQVRKALDLREKLLIRQLQVLEKQSHQFSKDIEFIPENETGLLHLIRVFGKLNVQKLNYCNDFLTTEDYICPQDDHVLINKQLIEEKETPMDSSPVAADDHLALVDDNANHINESLINLILSESKELIGKSSKLGHKKRSGPQANNKVNNKEGRHGNKKLQIGDTPAATVVAQSTTVPSSSFSSASAFLPKKKSSLKGNPHSNLTPHPAPAVTTGASLNPRRPTAIPLPSVTTDFEVQAVTCDFYKRLINENKLLRPNSQRGGVGAMTTTLTYSVKDTNPVIECPTPSSTDTCSTSFKEFCSDYPKKQMMIVDNSNWEECDGLPGGVLDANGNLEDPRPKQIQLWLKQIIHENELEPMQNTEMLEFSRIKSP